MCSHSKTTSEQKGAVSIREDEIQTWNSPNKQQLGAFERTPETSFFRSSLRKPKQKGEKSYELHGNPMNFMGIPMGDAISPLIFPPSLGRCPVTP